MDQSIVDLRHVSPFASKPKRSTNAFSGISRPRARSLVAMLESYVEHEEELYRKRGCKMLKWLCRMKASISGMKGSMAAG